MTVPTLAAQSPGIGVITADNLNTFVQGGAMVANLRTFTGLPNMTVYMIGGLAPNDGGQGFFYWNGTSTAADDGGITTVVPYGSTQGVWSRLSWNGNAIVSTASGVALTTTTTTPLCSLTLAIGNWAVSGVVTFTAAGSTTISYLTAGIAASPANNTSSQYLSATFTTGSTNALATGTALMTVASTTTVTLEATANFGTSTMSATGQLQAIVMGVVT